MQGPMSGVGLPQHATPIRQLSNVFGQRTIAAPEPAAHTMDHRFVLRPALYSRSASLASASSFPAAASASSCLSHVAASYSTNHFLNRARSFLGRRFTAPVISVTVLITEEYLLRRDRATRSRACPRAAAPASARPSGEVTEVERVIWSP